MDAEHGGFAGCVGRDGSVQEGADKGIVLNTRILWFFSELARTRRDVSALSMARRAYDYLIRCFLDTEHGGFYWCVDYQGQVVADRKQVFAQAFAIYAVSTYAQATGDSAARTLARDTAALLREVARNPSGPGFLESFDRDWVPASTMRLSERDVAAPLSMNTHLHIVEAVTRLTELDPSVAHRRFLREGIELLCDCFINEEGHLRLYLDVDGRDLSSAYSFGHDIECSWLLWEAVTVLGDDALTQRVHQQVLQMASVCADKALDQAGFFIEERPFDQAGAPYESLSVWWPQAEAMVGFVNAYALSGEARYLQFSEQLWDYIVAHHLDAEAGEWHWYSDGAQGPDAGTGYKAGFWKGPYHNGRAMMELLRRLPVSEVD